MNLIREAMNNLPGHWCQGAVEDGNGNYCGIGHVRRVYIDQPESTRAGQYSESLNAMDYVAREQYPDRLTEENSLVAFAKFNDHRDTTEEEVLMVMEKAAIKLDEIG